MSDSEKQLLHIIGKFPEISMKELLTHTKYKWVSTVVKKLEQLKEQGILRGPLYDFNYTTLCRNPFHKLVCILELNQSYETVISYLKLIESLIWIFPVLSSHKMVLQAGFLSSNNAETTALLQLLKDNDIISDYIVRASRCTRIVENPNLFGSPTPSLGGLLNPCELPDISPRQHETEWNECDIRILPHVLRGAKLIEILREEKKLHRSWTYEQVRYSREKLSRNGMVRKRYIFFPFPFSQCAYFHFFLKTGDTAVTQRILHNFARGERVYKEYSLYEDWGMLVCTSHPLLLIDLMHELDQIDEITNKELYHVRSNSSRYCHGSPPQLKHYDFENQTLDYPYSIYREKIREKIESEQLVHTV